MHWIRKTKEKQPRKMATTQKKNVLEQVLESVQTAGKIIFLFI
jgi:hypothetical protein